MSYKTYTLGDLIEKWIDNRGKTPPIASDGIPLLEVKHLPANGIYPITEGTKYVDQATYDSWFRAYLEPQDILFSTVGTTARVIMTPENRTVAIAQNVLGIRFKKEILDPWYMFYYMRGSKFQHDIKSRLITTVQASIKRADMVGIEVDVPPLSVQKSIVEKVYGLDRKVELNHQINQTLEQMAQAIFKSWFVDFEPVKAKIAALEAGGSEEYALLAAMQAISGKDEAELTRLQAEQPEQYAELRATAELFPSAMQDSELGEIPEGWGVDHLSELIQFNPRRSLKKGTLAPYLDMKNVPTSGHLADDVVLRQMNSGTKFVNGDTLLARITPCLENGKTAYVDFLDSDQVGWGSTEYIVMRSQEPYPESISYFIARDESFRQHAIQSMTGTSGRQRANAKALAELPWIVYPHALAEAFDRISTPYLKLAKSHGNESKSLSAIRDAVLPKLLSGELSVSDVEDQLAEDAEPANV
ncbi:restriction endonuclease subunit S [Marinobacter nauticus]|uniref:restriction endonuclease subunit S n=1 Tax=Marinobacter nauticus TaxID=2743 RepID=UPI000308400D|nr:restriction endonuclease subunit S [Marinobacter nauticus]